MKAPATDQKLRGGYYTPKVVADFLTRWAVTDRAASVLEPSFGDGVFVESAAETLLGLGAVSRDASNQLHGTEFDPGEAAAGVRRLSRLGLTPAGLSAGDSFERCDDWLHACRQFDAVIGNPPFIRYQHFAEAHRQHAFTIMHRAGLHPNRLTNAWVPFLVGSSLLLAPTGRLAMVIPAELLQVDYAAGLRRFLGDYFSRLTILTFRKLVFDEAQQEVVLLLAERNGSERTGIRRIELGGARDLEGFDYSTALDSPLKPMDHSSEKWTQYFLETPEILFLRELRSHPAIGTFGEVAEVDVGVVTGLNDFFVLTRLQAQQRGLEGATRRLVSRSGHLPGFVFSEADWLANAEREYPCLLLDAADVPADDLPAPVREYLRVGEDRGYHRGYKCRIRKRWHVVPSAWVPDAFMLRQIHHYPRVVLNAASATSTDTIHRVRFKPGVDPARVCAGFLSSLTIAFSEVVGRSYGGGVLELEPREAERLAFPRHLPADFDAEVVSRLVSQGEIESALDYSDEVILRRGVGLSPDQTRALRSIWRRLRDRRTARKFERRASDAGQPRGLTVVIGA